MNYLYLDSSALVKRYSREIGMDLVNEICQRKDTNLILSDIAIVELGSAFARKLRERIITEIEYATILSDFMDDYFHEYIRVAIDFEVLELAVKLAKKNALKAYDAVQLACAVQIRTEIASKKKKVSISFVVADTYLEKSVQAEGFITINPETFGT